MIKEISQNQINTKREDPNKYWVIDKEHEAYCFTFEVTEEYSNYILCTFRNYMKTQMWLKIEQTNYRKKENFSKRGMDS